MAFRVSSDAFEMAARSVFNLLPEELTAPLDNVHIFVEDEYDPLPDEAPDTQIFGYYVGTPLTERGVDEIGQLPDRIVLFKATFEDEAANWSDIVAELRTTLVHEIGHHVGIDEERLHELGWG